MSTKDNVKSAASDAAEKAKSAATEVARTVKDHAHTQADDAKNSVAGEVNSVASALRTASKEMRSGSPQERAMGQIAETLADVSESFRDQDFGEIVTAASDFARRNPIVFLGSAAFLGFAAARFAKSTSSSRASGRHSHSSVGAYQSPHPHTTANYSEGNHEGETS